MKLKLISESLPGGIDVIDVSKADRIDMIVKKVSVKFIVKYENIGFLYKNQILFNDKFVRDYQIGNDDIVVYFIHENCARYSTNDRLDIDWISDRSRELNIVRQMINDQENNEMIVIYVKNMNSCQVFQFHLPKCTNVSHFKQIVADKLNIEYKWRSLIVMEFQNYSLSDEKTLESYDIENGDTIRLTIYRFNRHICQLSILPLTAGYDRIESRELSNIDQIINEIHNKYNIDKINIRLYGDADKTESIVDIIDILIPSIDKSDNCSGPRVYYFIEDKINKYEICNKLGAGSFGISFQCKEKSSNQIYALKQFQISKENNSKVNVEKQLECFLAMEKHPRIVEIIKQINDIDSSYLLMEYIDRGSIGSIIKKNGALPEKEAAKYALHILEGLEYLHIHRIIHGNIKGSNILIDGNDNAKLSDFGLRTIFHKTSNRNSINEILQSEIGAINWLSPEMIRSGQLVPASDIWSFGAVMVEMITGQIPHYGLSVGQIVFAIMKGQIQFTCPGFYKEHVKAFISICLKAEPRERANFDDLYEHSFLK